jgi:plasmid stabilization system protein ParE
MRLIIRPEAESDLAQAFAWYQQQQPSLGYEFMEEASRCLQSIEERPLSFAKVKEPARRAILRRFPYALFFAVQTDLITVVAAFHMARHPDSLVPRLGPAP